MVTCVVTVVTTADYDQAVGVIWPKAIRSFWEKFLYDGIIPPRTIELTDVNGLNGEFAARTIWKKKHVSSK